jgi:hypothetical protein
MIQQIHKSGLRVVRLAAKSREAVSRYIPFNSIYIQHLYFCIHVFVLCNEKSVIVVLACSVISLFDRTILNTERCRVRLIYTYLYTSLHCICQTYAAIVFE